MSHNSPAGELWKNLLEWDINLKPNIGVYSTEKPFYSPDVYTALVWDRNI
jgi:hypothetical protein